MLDDPERQPPAIASWLEGPQGFGQAELLALRYMSHGLTRAQTAAATCKSEETIKTQLRACRYRLRAKNTTHAVAEAIRLGLIP